MSRLLDFIEEDFGIETKTNSRWAKSSEHDSLVVDKEKDIFYWNSQDIIGNAFDYLIKVRGLTKQQAKKLIKQDVITSNLLTKKSYNEVEVYPQLVYLFWKNGKEHREYWYNRKLTDYTIDRYQLGYYNDWYLIPIIMNNKLKDFQKRRDEPKKSICSWYKGVGPVLWNSDILKITNKIIITEGTVDAILLSQFGLPAVGYIGGTYGWRTEWFKYFTRQKEIYYIADNDKAGKIAANWIAERLGEYRVKIYTFKDKENKYDTVQFFRDGNSLEEFKDRVYNDSVYRFQL